MTMREDSAEQPRPLRTGYTTGACATATSLAAASMLLSAHAAPPPLAHISITLPNGRPVEFALASCTRRATTAYASTVKDAGDDPDVTHAATIFTEVALSPLAGVRFYAAAGVGTVTRAGLSLAVGEAAVNPVPRRMIGEHLQHLAEARGYAGGFEVHVGVVDGEYLATKTMNARLGILGGVSILGTTGIVRPFSCAAYIASIHQSIDVARANNIQHIAACTGATSERYIQAHLNLADMACVEMGDFVGAVLKYLRRRPLRKLSLCGGFGKISKLAAGHHTLHSRDSSIDFEFLATQATALGGSSQLAKAVTHANTSLAALALCQQHQLPLGQQLCRLAKQTAQRVLRDCLEVEVYAVDRQGECVGYSG